MCFEFTKDSIEENNNVSVFFITLYLSLQVAMTREKFPEKIPFRLTRMLTNAMEVRMELYSNWKLARIPGAYSLCYSY